MVFSWLRKLITLIQRRRIWLEKQLYFQLQILKSDCKKGIVETKCYNLDYVLKEYSLQ